MHRGYGTGMEKGKVERKALLTMEFESARADMGYKMITSTANQKVKRVVQLNKKPGLRKKEGVFAAEGLKMFLEAPESRLEEIYVSEGFFGDASGTDRQGWQEAFAKLERCGYETVSEEVFAKLSDTQSPQGILCVVRQSEYTLDAMMGTDKKPLFLVLENLQDPGNLGTIMRTGEGAGVSGIVMSRDTVDIYNPKTIRATMGSVYRVPFLYVEDIRKTVRRMKENGIGIYAAHLKGKKCYDTCDYCGPAAFLIGNEGNGLTEETAELADTYIRIPMEGKLESLNAAVAAALLMYEAAGQRRRNGRNGGME